jgi:type IV pilus assembly protein PilB
MKPDKLSSRCRTDESASAWIPDLNRRLDDEIISILPQSVILKYQIIPVRRAGDQLYIAVTRIPHVTLLQELSFITGCSVLPIKIPDTEFRKAMMQNFGIGLRDCSGLSEESSAASVFPSFRAGSGSVVKEIDYIIDYAITHKISDIHFEPLNDQFRVRIRRDGFLSTLYSLPFKKHPQMISRLKIMARLDIAEKRSPQDGNIQYKSGDKAVDIRVSSLPTETGEKIVLRILDKSDRLLSLESLGFEESQISQIKRVLESPHGLFIVTGPTGSGKTTTLYASLAYLNRDDINILTVEDPVEYNVEGVTQVRVRPELDFSFAKALRTFLRQDPDIIMIGEIRDRETASIAIRAALTGHLVLSTLHTNDAVTTLFRLLDMGIEPFLLCSTLRLIIAQRLVRRICPSCKITPEINRTKMHGLTSVDGPEETEAGGAMAKGCFDCNFTGYSGRTVIAELLPWTDTLTDLTLNGASIEDLKEYIRKQRITDMYTHGKMKVEKGITTIGEIRRETGLSL